MRHLPVLAVGLLALVGVTPRPAVAQQVDFWIGFGGIQTKSMIAVTPEGRISGKTRYIDVVVGSNENADTAQPHTFAVHLNGYGSTGSCNTFTEVTTKVKPAVSLLRFSVFYPDPKPAPPGVRGTRLPGLASPPVDLTLKAHLSGASDGHYAGGNNSNTFTFSFPGGGKAPGCTKLK